MTARGPKVRVDRLRLRLEGPDTPADVSRAMRQALAMLTPEDWRRLATDPTGKVVLDRSRDSAAKAIGRAMKGSKA